MRPARACLSRRLRRDIRPGLLGSRGTRPSPGLAGTPREPQVSLRGSFRRTCRKLLFFFECDLLTKYQLLFKIPPKDGNED